MRGAMTCVYIIALAMPSTTRAEPREYEGPRSVETSGENTTIRPIAEEGSLPAKIAAEGDRRPSPAELDVDAEMAAQPIDDDGYDPLRHSPEAIRSRHFIRAGVVLLVVGTALGVGALALGLSDPCAKPAGNSCQPDARNRAALTMGVPGAVMLVGGATMLGLGLRQRARIRADLAVTVTSAVARLSWNF